MNESKTSIGGPMYQPSDVPTALPTIAAAIACGLGIIGHGSLGPVTHGVTQLCFFQEVAIRIKRRSGFGMRIASLSP
jgi:hypothetical protein